jgi:2-dehydro-3-deoxygluconokinase
VSCGRPRRVVTLGEALLRLTTHEGERLEDARELRVHVAGAEANVAAGLARLGVDVAWLSRLPKSPLGRRVAADMGVAGVDVEHICWAEDGSRIGIFYAEASAAPRATQVWYDRRDSAFAQMDPGELDERVLAGASWAVLSGITPALGASARSLADHFVSQARAHGVKVCLDVNYRANLWSPAEAQTALAPLIRAASVVVCGRADAERVFGLGGADIDVARLLQEAYCPEAELVVLTLGHRGCLTIDEAGTVLDQPSFPAEVLDPFGTGDAFVAGLIWGLLDGAPREAVARASAVAALKCTVRGDQARISAEEVESLLDHGPMGVVR